MPPVATVGTQGARVSPGRIPVARSGVRARGSGGTRPGGEECRVRRPEAGDLALCKQLVGGRLGFGLHGVEGLLGPGLPPEPGCPPLELLMGVPQLVRHQPLVSGGTVLGPARPGPARPEHDVLPRRTPEDIRRGLWAFYRWCADAQIPELTRLAETIETWWSAIEVFLTTGITNARTEGTNRLIKQVKRAACGFRNR